MEYVRQFLACQSGQVFHSNLIYFVVLGLFFTVASSMVATENGRSQVGERGPTIELNLNWLPGSWGRDLPQIGPLSNP
ncbi:MAG: hypothetical protein AAF914_09065 [Pseudomonadota bacterium]